MFSQFVFVLKIKIKQAFPLLVHMRHEISVLIELTLGHLRFHLRDAPPQPNSPPDYVFRTDQLPKRGNIKSKTHMMRASVFSLTEYVI